MIHFDKTRRGSPIFPTPCFFVAKEIKKFRTVEEHTTLETFRLMPVESKQEPCAFVLSCIQIA